MGTHIKQYALQSKLAPLNDLRLYLPLIRRPALQYKPVLAPITLFFVKITMDGI